MKSSEFRAGYAREHGWSYDAGPYPVLRAGVSFNAVLGSLAKAMSPRWATGAVGRIIHDVRGQLSVNFKEVLEDLAGAAGAEGTSGSGLPALARQLHAVFGDLPPDLDVSHRTLSVLGADRLETLLGPAAALHELPDRFHFFSATELEQLSF